ncbi:hypothetical protein TNCV_144051 [Trichonephila clavipes]|nr:hypothetical protein TNCV_144051 [Trichonephila clavipes]
MTSRKGLSLDGIANLLQDHSENESDGGKLSCFNIDSDEGLRLPESDCEESEESADKIKEYFNKYSLLGISQFDTA